jgi:hypothetical protein
MAGFQARVENERGECLLLVQSVEQAVEKCRLAPTDFALQKYKTVADLGIPCSSNVLRVQAVRYRYRGSGLTLKGFPLKPKSCL